MDINVREYLDASRIHGELVAKDMWTKCISYHDKTRDRIRSTGLLTISQHRLRKLENSFLVYMNESDVAEVVGLGYQQSLIGRELMEVKIEREYRPWQVVRDGKAFINLTKLDIPDDVSLGFSWGPKFTFPYILNSYNIENYMAQLNYTVEETVPTALYDQVFREISKHLDSEDQIIHDDQIKWLLFLKYRMDSFLRNHTDVIPTLADKGKIVVLMEIEEYKDKILQHLEDPLHYQLTDFNPLEGLIDKEREFLGLLRDNALTKEFVGPYQDNCMELPKFYATIKVHKNNRIRPITSNAGNIVGANLNLVFKKILLGVFPQTTRHCKNALEVKNAVTLMEISLEDVLVSYDAVSMFTSIPTELILHIIEDRLELFLEHYRLEGWLVMRIARFLLNECVFITAFDRIYRQTHGIPMGGSISPICCRLVMDHIIDKVLLMIPRPKYVSVYVDDTFFIINGQFVQTTLDALNSVNSHIQFTYELEIAGTLNFLNLTLYRGLAGVRTNWYKKSLSSDRLLNYFSSHKRSTVVNTAKQFIRTVVDLSDCNLFEDNRNKIVHTLRVNCFPETLIIMLLHENYTYMRALPIGGARGDNRYVSFPHQLNNKVIKDIVRSYKTSQSILAESIKNNKINHIRIYKTPTHDDLKTNIIMMVECECKQKIRIDMTKFNETSLMLRNRLVTGGAFCLNDQHAFANVTIRRGLHTRRQTTLLLDFIRWRCKDRFDGICFQFPNRHLRGIISKRVTQ